MNGPLGICSVCKLPVEDDSNICADCLNGLCEPVTEREARVALARKGQLASHPFDESPAQTDAGIEAMLEFENELQPTPEQRAQQFADWCCEEGMGHRDVFSPDFHEEFARHIRAATIQSGGRSAA